MKKLFLGLLLLTSISFTSFNCSDPCERIGAICNDGTRSSATGSGACSHHGGVKEWICE
jgi:hypothetical protein